MKNNRPYKKSSLTKRVADNWRMYIMLAPFFVFFSIFVVYPVIMSVVLSFTEYNVLEAPVFVGLNNYRRLFLEDTIFTKALTNTIIYAVITGPVGYLISFFMAWIINEFGRYMRALLTFIFYIPSISGTIYTIWGIIFDSDIYGFANSFLMNWGFIDNPIDWFTNEKYILALIIIIQLWMSMGVGFLAMRAGFSTADSECYEAAAIDGVKNRWQELYYITIPMMAPHLLTAAVLQITNMFSNAVVSQTLAGNPSTNYAGHLLINHLNDYSAIRMERGYASAIAVLLFFIMISINALILRLVRKVSD